MKKINAIRVHLLMFIVLSLFSGCIGRSDQAPGVNPNTIRAVRIGMSEAELVRTLGAPLVITFNKWTGRIVYQYTRPVKAWWYPMLWVHLKQGKVDEVYAKRYIWLGIDDRGVYGLSKSRQWEAKDFESTFRLR